ncbi:10019_t:CDS:2, partial [Funneliformis caledonium]
MYYPKGLNEVNKQEYVSNTIWLATSISQISQISLRSTVEYIATSNWITLSTLCTWQQDISTLYTNAQIYQFWNQKDQVPVITVAHLKDIPSCNVNTISNTITKQVDALPCLDDLDTEDEKCTYLRSLISTSDILPPSCCQTPLQVIVEKSVSIDENAEAIVDAEVVVNLSTSRSILKDTYYLKMPHNSFAIM